MDPVSLILFSIVMARGVMEVAEDLGGATWEGTRDAGARAYRSANERYGRIRDAAVSKAERMPAANPKHPGWWLWLLGAGAYHGGRNIRRGVREAGQMIRGSWRRGTGEGNAWKAEVLQGRQNHRHIDNVHACEMRGKGNGACTKDGVVAKREDVDPPAWLCRDHWRSQRLNRTTPEPIGSRPPGPPNVPTPQRSANAPTPEGIASPPSAAGTSAGGGNESTDESSGTSANESTKGTTMPTAATEASAAANLEVTKRAATQLQESAIRDFEIASHDKTEAETRIASLDHLSASLAQAGLTGGVMEALAAASEAAQARKAAADEAARNADQAKAAADRVLKELQAHESAADALAAIQGGAARDTRFYVPGLR